MTLAFDFSGYEIIQDVLYSLAEKVYRGSFDICGFSAIHIDPTTNPSRLYGLDNTIPALFMILWEMIPDMIRMFFIPTHEDDFPIRFNPKLYPIPSRIRR